MPREGFDFFAKDIVPPVIDEDTGMVRLCFRSGKHEIHLLTTRHVGRKLERLLKNTLDEADRAAQNVVLPMGAHGIDDDGTRVA